MICDICGKEGARTRLVTRNYGKGENLRGVIPRGGGPGTVGRVRDVRS